MAAPKRKRAAPKKKQKPAPLPTDADKAALAATAPEPRGPGRPTGDRYELYVRDTEIFRGRMRGLDEWTLGQTYDLSPEAIRKIVDQQVKLAQTLPHAHPNTIVEYAMGQFDAAIAELAIHASQIEGKKHPSAKTGAIVARVSVIERRIALLQDVGLLPEDLGKLRALFNLGELHRLLIDLFERHGMSDAAFDDLQNLLPATVTGPSDEDIDGNGHEVG